MRAGALVRKLRNRFYTRYKKEEEGEKNGSVDLILATTRVATLAVRTGYPHTLTQGNTNGAKAHARQDINTRTRLSSNEVRPYGKG